MQLFLRAGANKSLITANWVNLSAQGNSTLVEMSDLKMHVLYIFLLYSFASPVALCLSERSQVVEKEECCCLFLKES